MACLCRRSWALWTPRRWDRGGDAEQMVVVRAQLQWVRQHHLEWLLRRDRPLQPVHLLQAFRSSAVFLVDDFFVERGKLECWD